MHFRGVDHGVPEVSGEETSSLPDERASSSTSLRGKDLKLAKETVERCLRKDSASSVEKPNEKWANITSTCLSKEQKLADMRQRTGPQERAEYKRA